MLIYSNILTYTMKTEQQIKSVESVFGDEAKLIKDGEKFITQSGEYDGSVAFVSTSTGLIATDTWKDDHDVSIPLGVNYIARKDSVEGHDVVYLEESN